MYGYKELNELQSIVNETVVHKNKLQEIVIFLNRTEQLDDFLEMLGIPSNNYNSKKGKIVVIGASKVSKKCLLSVAEELGLSKERFEFCLDYNKAKKFNFKKLLYNHNYSLIMIGPMPHSSSEKNDFSSVLKYLHDTPGFPPVIGLGLPTLKITKNIFQKALEDLIARNIIIKGEKYVN